MPGAARPRGVGIDGAGAWVIASQRRQAYFGQTWRITRNRPGLYLKCSGGISRNPGARSEDQLPEVALSSVTRAVSSRALKIAQTAVPRPTFSPCVCCP
jgi:hypothetical protein